MRKDSRLLRFCGRIMLIVILMSFLTTFPVYGEPPTAQGRILNENGMRYYSDSEIELLIEDLSAAAKEAIEKAAGEAAKAAVLASIEREAAALREAAKQQAEALQWRREAETRLKSIREAKRAGVRNAVITGLSCLAGGLVVGLLVRN